MRFSLTIVGAMPSDARRCDPPDASRREGGRKVRCLVPGLNVLAAVVYVAGVVWGLLAIDARPAARVGLALLWPLGPLTFVIVVAILLAASLIAYPLFGLMVVLMALVGWWVLF